MSEQVTTPDNISPETTLINSDGPSPSSNESFTDIIYNIDKMEPLPIEILMKIIGSLKVDSKQFLLDYLNILKAIKEAQFSSSSKNNNQDFLLNSLMKFLKENFQNQIDIIDIEGIVPNYSSPIINDLQSFFPDCIKSISSEFRREKYIFIINDNTLSKFFTFESFNKSFMNQIFKTDLGNYVNIPFDIIYCPLLQENPLKQPNESFKSPKNYLNTDDSLLTNFISYFPENFKLDNLIFDFNHSNIYFPRNLFGLFTTNAFVYSKEVFQRTSRSQPIKWLIPKCKQITFASVTSVLMDYMAMDSFISNIFDNYSIGRDSYSSSSYYSNCGSIHDSISPVHYLFNSYLNDIKFYLPNVVNLTFTNANCPNATCNFIDLSTNILEKIKTNNTTLQCFFKIHSLSNWQMNNLTNFGGHRFKFDSTTMTGSLNRTNEALNKNIKRLSGLINEETKDGVTYLRINLFPPTVKKSKLLNWLPLLPNEYNNNDTSSSSSSSSTSSRTVRPLPIGKPPLLCLKSKCLESLELRILAIGLHKTNHIQGLFLPNLQKLILQNFEFDINSPSMITSNNKDHFQNDNNDLTMFNDLNIYPTGFSSWNDLPNCKLINLKDNVKQSDQNKSHSIHLVFSIDNLKQILPKINLNESFYTFVDNKQKFIVV